MYVDDIYKYVCLCDTPSELNAKKQEFMDDAVLYFNTAVDDKHGYVSLANDDEVYFMLKPQYHRWNRGKSYYLFNGNYFNGYLKVDKTEYYHDGVLIKRGMGL